MICAARPTLKARVGQVSLKAGRAPARSVKAQYTVTLEMPGGTEKLEVADDVYILDAAEVRLNPEPSLALDHYSHRGMKYFLHFQFVASQNRVRRRAARAGPGLRL